MSPCLDSGEDVTGIKYLSNRVTQRLHGATAEAENKKDPQAEACKSLIYCTFFGVTDGARTHDNRNHNPGLYQLSYSHR